MNQHGVGRNDEVEQRDNRRGVREIFRQGEEPADIGATVHHRRGGDRKDFQVDGLGDFIFLFETRRRLGSGTATE
jgi:hypothetical protein